MSRRDEAFAMTLVWLLVVVVVVAAVAVDVVVVVEVMSWQCHMDV
jgi:hypothetical protein